jgi:hypothetical protein
MSNNNEFFDPSKVVTDEELKIYRNPEGIKKDLRRIPKSIGDRIVIENSNPDYEILIHRTITEDVQNIFKNGLYINGGDDLEYTTSRYKSNWELLQQISWGWAYKNSLNDPVSSRVIIAKIPKSALKYEPGKSKPILFVDNNGIAQVGNEGGFDTSCKPTILLPEYILGSIEFDKKNIKEFKKNPNYTNNHNYKNNGLTFPSELIDDYFDKNPDIREKQIAKAKSWSREIARGNVLEEKRKTGKTDENGRIWCTAKEIDDYLNNHFILKPDPYKYTYNEIKSKAIETIIKQSNEYDKNPEKFKRENAGLIASVKEYEKQHEYENLQEYKPQKRSAAELKVFFKDVTTTKFMNIINKFKSFLKKDKADKEQTNDKSK